MMKLGPLFQLALLFIIFILVLQSHMRSSFAQEKLLQFREEESQLMLHLQKIERHSLRLHENIRRRLQKAGIPEDDEDPLLTQTSQLYQMSEELNEQVGSLEESIKHQSRDNIIRELGEGPVKVVLELEFLDKDESLVAQPPNNFQRRRTESNTQISILLWPETPHAAWTWLEQIERHIWDGAVFHWSTSQPVLEVAPSKADPLQRGRLEFTEHVTDHSNWHGAWTVGMRETNGKLQMFFNLQDNAEYQKHETCVGKVLDGFDALQRLLEAPRRQNGDVSSIRIKKANAMHVTKRELGIV
jgi:cyclophilin family peptidyl-prolyl cis-trans isomerase